MLCISDLAKATPGSGTDVNGLNPSCGSDPSMGTAGKAQESGKGSQTGMGREGCPERSNPNASLMGTAAQLLWGCGERKTPKHNTHHHPVKPRRSPTKGNGLSFISEIFRHW